MKNIILFSTAFILLISCDDAAEHETAKAGDISLQGTWKLISGTLIEKNDTTVTNYLNDTSFIKIINATHFSFLGHDLTKKDSAAFFTCGGGKYDLHDSNYTEHLEYCNAREWEGNDFKFTVRISNDTLIQQGVEKIDSLNINRLNIEKYVRLK